MKCTREGAMSACRCPTRKFPTGCGRDAAAPWSDDQATPSVHEIAPGQRFPSPNQPVNERGATWRAGLRPNCREKCFALQSSSAWESHLGNPGRDTF